MAAADLAGEGSELLLSAPRCFFEPCLGAPLLRATRGGCCTFRHVLSSHCIRDISVCRRPFFPPLLSSFDPMGGYR